MRVPLLFVSCGVAAAVALLAWRSFDSDGHPSVALPASAVHAPEAAAASAPAGSSPQATAPGTTPSSATRGFRAAFALSSDHQSLVEQTVLAVADHDKLEQEARDDAWATESESRIRQELAKYPGAADFDVVNIDCRRTMCAVQAFSYGEKNQRGWVNAMDELLFTKSLAGDFDMVNTAFPNKGGRAAVLTFFHRRTVAVAMEGARE